MRSASYRLLDGSYQLRNDSYYFLNYSYQRSNGLRYLRAGVDSAWEQKKLEAGKMLVKRRTPQNCSPTRQVHALLGRRLH